MRSIARPAASLATAAATVLALAALPTHAAADAAPRSSAAPSAAAPPSTTAASTGALRTILGTVPAYVHRLTALGQTADATPVRALVALRQRDEVGLSRFIAQVSDPHSSRYGHYLTPAEFEARYAPTDAAVDTVSAAARAAGLRVTDVPRNNAFVMVAGTAGQAERFFHTTLANFTVSGQAVHAPTSAVRLPDALANLVVDVKGLDTADVAQRHADPPPAFVNAEPCSAYWAQSPSTLNADGFPGPLPNVPCGYTPKQLQGAYGTRRAIDAGLDGTGVRVAIIDAFSSPRIDSDVAEWSKRRGLPPATIEVHDNFQQRNTPQGPALPPVDIPVVGDALGILGLLDPHGWSGEQTLDVEAVHAMAPGATIVYQGANSPLNMDFNVAQNEVVSKNLAQIISNSYGGSTDDVDDVSDNIWKQAAAQGIGSYFATGDDADEAGDTGDLKMRSVGAGGNSPFVTAVGGTTLAVGAQDNYLFETYWGTKSATLKDGKFVDKPVYNAGGGGGTSQAYAQPDYQKGAVPDDFASFWKDKAEKVDGAKIPGRVTPDVAMVGDANSGFLMGMVQDHTAYRNVLGTTLPGDDTHYSEYRIGGTSLSAPLFAGVMALADQAAGKRHGFANPALYEARRAGAFRDISAPVKPVAVIRTNFKNQTNGDDGTETVLRTAGNVGTLKSIPGYDDSTGLGSPLGLAFLRALAPGSKLVPADTPATTCRNSSLRFKLGGKTKRIVSVQVRVGKTTVVSRRGHRLTAVTVPFPKDKERFTISIRTRTSTGRVTTSTRELTAYGCKIGKATVKRTG